MKSGNPSNIFLLMFYKTCLTQNVLLSIECIALLKVCLSSKPVITHTRTPLCTVFVSQPSDLDKCQCGDRPLLCIWSGRQPDWTVSLTEKDSRFLCSKLVKKTTFHGGIRGDFFWSILGAYSKWFNQKTFVVFFFLIWLSRTAYWPA